MAKKSKTAEYNELRRQRGGATAYETIQETRRLDLLIQKAMRRCKE